MATVNTGAPIYNIYTNTVTNAAEKSFMMFNLPSLDGGTITAAVLTCYANSIGGSGCTPDSLVSEDVSWDETTGFSALDAITFLGAATASTPVNMTGSKTWDVLGTTNGIAQAYADFKSVITVCLRGTTGGSAGTSAVGVQVGGFIVYNGAAFDARGATNYPNIQITYTPVDYHPRPVMLESGMLL